MPLQTSPRQKPPLRSLLRKAAALLTAFFLALGSLPLSSLAAPAPPTVNLFSLETIEGEETRVFLRGNNLKGARVVVNDVSLDNLSKEINAQIISEIDSFTMIFKGGDTAGALSGLGQLNFIEQGNILTVTSAEGAQSEFVFDFSPKFPQFSYPKQPVYIKKPLVIAMQNMDQSVKNAAKVSRFHITNLPNDYTYDEQTEKATIAQVQATPLGEKSIYLRNEYAAPEKAGTAQPIGSVYKYQVKNKLDLRSPIPGIDALEVIPTRGSYKGGTLLRLKALKKAVNGALETIEDQNVFDTDMIVTLISQDGKRVPALNPTVLRNQRGFKNGLTAVTAPISLDQKGLYHVELTDKKTGSSLLKEDAFLYVDAADNALQLDAIDPPSGPSQGGKYVTVKGRNLLDASALPGLILEKGASIRPVSAAPKADEQSTWLVVTYQIKGDAFYQADPKEPSKRSLVQSIARWIKADIGGQAEPVAGEILSALPAPGSNAHFFSQSPALEGVVFKTRAAQSLAGASADVKVETRTLINTGAQVIDSILQQDTLKNAYRYTGSPQISAVEPPYGYPNAAKEAPLRLRVAGTGFKVIQKKNDKGILTPHYPAIKIYSAKDAREFRIGSEAVFDPAKTRVVKVLKEDGSEVNGEPGNDQGAVLVIDVGVPKGDFAGLIREQGSAGAGYKSLKAKIAVFQDQNPENPNDIGSDNLTSLSKEPSFELRYPESNEALRQPVIDQVLYQGAPVGVLNAERDNPITVRYSASPVTNLDKVLLTVDGKVLPAKKEFDPSDKRYALLTATVPKGLYGKVPVQVIVQEGLMDSVDLNFQAGDGPVLEQIVPAQGQAGTQVLIKRNAKASNTAFVPGQEPARSSQVFFDGKPSPAQTPYEQEVIDADTLRFTIPQDAKPGLHSIQVQNPDGSQSQALLFTVVEVGADAVKILSITPDRGDIKGQDTSLIVLEKRVKPGPVEVFFGKQNAKVIEQNADFTQIKVQVPPLTEAQVAVGGTYSVPVLVQSVETKANDTKKDGYTYTNAPGKDRLKIREIYKKDVFPPTNQGVAGDTFIIAGDFFLAEPAKEGALRYPRVVIGGNDAQVVGPALDPAATGPQFLDFVEVIIPKAPSPLPAGGAVDVAITNRGSDGQPFIAAKGFVYIVNNLVIDQKKSELRASRFGETVRVQVQGLLQRGLIAAFGDKTDRKEAGGSMTTLESSHDTEKLRFVFQDGASPGSKKASVYYVPAVGQPTLMEAYELDEDYQRVPGASAGELVLPGVGHSKKMAVKWNDTRHHTQSALKDKPQIVSKIQDEILSISLQKRPGSNVSEYVVRRGLGKVTLTPGASWTSIETPYNDKAQKTTLTLINPDGSFASAPFEFHSGLAFPVITDLAGSKLRKLKPADPAPVKLYSHDIKSGGSLKILGKEFRDVLYVRIGSYEAKVESISPDYSAITVAIPQGAPADLGKPLAVTVVTKEGAVYSDQNQPPLYFMYIEPGSAPLIQDITPANGPRTGATRLTLLGTGFRETDEFGAIPQKQEERLTVTINGAPASVHKVLFNEKKEINGVVVSAPAGKAGPAKIQVKNPDGGLSPEKPWSYVSQPVITKIDNQAFKNDKRSVIKVIGEDFQSGAKVILGAKQVPVAGNKEGVPSAEQPKPQGQLMLGVKDGLNQYVTLEGGLPGASVKVLDDKTLTFTMPAGAEKLSGSIIIVNPDSGVSPPGAGAGKDPIPDIPVLRAVPGFNRTMLLTFSVDPDTYNKGEKFEIYTSLAGRNAFAYSGQIDAGDQKDLRFVVKGLAPSTRYDFKVRVLNAFGEAKDFGFVSASTLSPQEDYKEQEKIRQAEKDRQNAQQQGKSQIIGDTYTHTLGASEEGIDLRASAQSVRSGAVPISLIRSQPSKNLLILDKDISLQLPLGALWTPKVSAAPAGSYVKITLQGQNSRAADALKGALPFGMKRASTISQIRFEVVEPTRSYPLESLASSATLGFNSRVTPSWLALYDESQDRFEAVPGGVIREGGFYVLLTKK